MFKPMRFTSVRFLITPWGDSMCDARLEDMSRDGWEIKTSYVHKDHVTIYLQRDQ